MTDPFRALFPIPFAPLERETVTLILEGDGVSMDTLCRHLYGTYNPDTANTLRTVLHRARRRMIGSGWTITYGYRERGNPGFYAVLPSG